MKQKIIVGRTESEFIRLELETEQDYNKGNHFSICATGIETEFFNEEKGEEMARGNLESCEDYLERKEIAEMWASGRSKEDYVEEVLNIDGWQHVVGDVEEIGELYSVVGGGGQHQPKIKEYEKFYILEKDLKFIYRMWNKYHLKDIKTIPKEELDKIKEIFKNESDFNDIPNIDSEFYSEQLSN